MTATNKQLGKTFFLVGLFLSLPVVTTAQNGQQDIIELETTTIKGNTELPKYMYVVPWQDSKERKGGEQKLVLHNLYADLFDPVMPSYQESIERTVLHSGPAPQTP